MVEIFRAKDDRFLARPTLAQGNSIALVLLELGLVQWLRRAPAGTQVAAARSA